MSIASQPIQQFRVREGSGIVVMSRVTDWQDVKVAKAAVSTLTYYVYDLSTGADQPTLKASGSISVATAWSDTYSVLGWDVDTVGYNAACPIPASALTFPLTRVKGSKVQVEIIGHPVSGDDFCVADLTLDVMDMFSQGT